MTENSCFIRFKFNGKTYRFDGDFEVPPDFLKDNPGAEKIFDVELDLINKGVPYGQESASQALQKIGAEIIEVHMSDPPYWKDVTIY